MSSSIQILRNNLKFLLLGFSLKVNIYVFTNTNFYLLTYLDTEPIRK